MRKGCLAYLPEATRGSNAVQAFDESSEYFNREVEIKISSAWST